MASFKFRFKKLIGFENWASFRVLNRFTPVIHIFGINCLLDVFNISIEISCLLIPVQAMAIHAEDVLYF